MDARALLVVLVACFSGGCLVGPLFSASEALGPGVRVTGFLASDMTLQDTPENATHEVRAGSFFQKWAAGTDYPTWNAAAATRDAIVPSVNVTLVVRVTGPVARTFRFPDLMVYAGAGGSWMAINTTQTDPVLTPGKDYRYHFDISGPKGGIWLPADQSLGIKVVPVMHQNDGSDVLIVTGGSDPSRVEWMEVPIAPLPALAFVAAKDAGDLAGSEYAGPAAPASARHATKVEVPPGAHALYAWMNTTQTQGIPDLDLELLGPDGKQIAFAGTPTPREFMQLRDVDLVGPGTYSLVTHNYGSARAQFILEWAVG